MRKKIPSVYFFGKNLDMFNGYNWYIGKILDYENLVRNLTLVLISNYIQHLYISLDMFNDYNWYIGKILDYENLVRNLTLVLISNYMHHLYISWDALTFCILHPWNGVSVGVGGN